jgi:hypothetical protein
MRDIIAAIAKSVVENERPGVRYATVISVDGPNRKAVVTFIGETSEVPVAIGSIQPTVGQVVRIGGPRGDRYIEDVMGPAVGGGGGGEGDYQPLDSDLSAIAALATAAFGRELLTLADAAAARTALGLGSAATTASTAYDTAGSAAAAQAAAIAASQPLDSDLSAIAALTTTAFGRGLLALADAAALLTAAGVSAFGATLVDDADAATARATLGLGSAATTASTAYDPAGSAAAAQAAAIAASQPLDSDLSAIAALTTTAFGRGFLALADAAAARTALELGTAATTASTAYDPAGSAAAAQAASQPLDSDLTAIAALTTTVFGRGFLVLADAAAARTALGLANGATLTLDADLATFSLPASTTISAFGASLVDDADAYTARTTLAAASAATLESVLGDLLYVGIYAPNTVTVVNKALTSNVATIDTSTAHGLVAGEIVKVSDVGAPFDGLWTVASAPTTTSLTYAVTNANIGSTACTGEAVQMPTPTWAGPSTSYRHGMWWLVASSSYLNFIDTDLSGRNEAIDGLYQVLPGDWVIATDPAFNPADPDTNLVLSAMTFQVLPFSAETLARALLAEHEAKTNDPHTAAGYLLRAPTATVSTVAAATKALASNVATLTTATAHGLSAGSEAVVNGVGAPFDGVWTLATASGSTLTYDCTNADISVVAATGTVGAQDSRRFADDVFAPTVHAHPAEIAAAIDIHEGLADPHPGYITTAEGDAAYAPLGHLHGGVYEPAGSVAAHAALSDPHTQYLTQAEADGLYPPLSHSGRADHDGRYALISQIPLVPRFVRSTDLSGANNTVWLGDVDPSVSFAAELQVGDIWLETFNIAIPVPTAPANFLAASSVGSSVELTWSIYGAAGTQTEVQLDRENTVGGGTWTNLLTDVAATFDTSYTDTGRVENTAYSYRIRFRNATGYGPYSTVTKTTANAAPSVPTSLATNAVAHTDTTIRLSWTKPAQWAVGTVGQRVGADDPGNDGARYEAFKNGVSQGYATGDNAYFDFTGLTENTQYKLGVKAVDYDGAKSTEAFIDNSSITTGSKTLNGVPPNVSGLTVTDQNYNQIKADWSAVTGISDLAGYRVKLFLTSGLVLQQTITTTSLTYTFTGLSYSTGYTVTVEAYDTNADGAGIKYSATPASAADTTQASPDTTPPGEATGYSFKPEGSYGVMTLRWTYPSDVGGSGLGTFTVQRSTDGANWTNDGATINASGLEGTAGSRSINGGTAYAAGTTVYARLIITDGLGNSRTGAAQSYALITSPSVFNATATKNFTENGYPSGSWNQGTPYQGYYSDPTQNNRGCFFYGTGPQSIYDSRRTITGGSMYLKRETAGSSALRYPHLVRHSYTSQPGVWPTLNTADETASAQGFRTANYDPSADEYWISLPSGWAASLVAGTYKGLALYTAGGSQFSNWSDVGVLGSSGQLSITHLG